MANTIGAYNRDASNDIGAYERYAVIEVGDWMDGSFTEAEWWTRRHKLNRTDNRRRQRDPIRTNRSDDE